jgi:cytochrome c oxidase subunit 2
MQVQVLPQPKFLAMLKYNSINIFCDAPVHWQTSFSEPASPTMEGIIEFHNHLMVILSFIALFVGWLLISCMQYYVDTQNDAKAEMFVHSADLEIVWTSLPAVILVILSVPSFSLLYSMDEIVDPAVTLKVIGHQWYWSYEYSDYTTCLPDKSTLKYNCYMMVLDGLPNKEGYFRLLETNKRVVLPTNTHLRLLVSAADVLHSWTVPSFGVKVDACPGRLNQLSFFIKRSGLYFGQCSEICGVNHAFMPIVVLAVEMSNYTPHIFSESLK